MTARDKAASPVLSVRDAVGATSCLSFHTNNIYYYELGKHHALRTLGINPDESVAAVRQRLAQDNTESPT